MKKIFKTTLAFGLMLSMMVCGVQPAYAASTSLKVSASKTTLYLLDGNNIKSQLKCTYGAKTVTTAAKYRASSKKIVTVSKKGVVTAKKAGKVKITAKYKGKSRTIKLTVKEAKLSLNEQNASLNTGEQAQLKCYANKSVVSNKNISWSSSNANVATVNNNGLVVAKYEGSAIITAKTSIGETAMQVVVKKEKDNSGEDTSQGEKDYFTIKLDAAGGNCAVKFLKIRKNNAVLATQIPEATKAGLTFSGWYDSDGNRLTDEIIVTKNMAYTAKYIDTTGSDYAVTFISKYNRDPITYIISKNSKLGKLPDNPKRTGYTFQGWYTSYVDKTATRITTDTVISHDMTVYAKWTPKTSKSTNKLDGNVTWLDVNGWRNGATQYSSDTAIRKLTLTAKSSKKVSESDYKNLINVKYVRSMYKDYLLEYNIDSLNSDTEVRDFFYKNMMFKGFRPASDFDPDYYYDYVRMKYGTTLSNYKDVYDFYIRQGQDKDPTYSQCKHERSSSYDDAYVAINTSYSPDVYTIKTTQTKIRCACGEIFDSHDDWDVHKTLQGLMGDTFNHSYSAFDMTEKVFAKQEDHAHTDRNLIIYCGNTAKKVSSKCISRVYDLY